MKNEELRKHSIPLPVQKMVECPFKCRPVPVEDCETCEYCACYTPLVNHVSCSFVWVWEQKQKEDTDESKNN